MFILNLTYFLLNKFQKKFYTNTVLQGYTDYIGNDETNLLDKLAIREWLATRA